MGFKAVLLAIEANLANNTRDYQMNSAFHSPVWLMTFTNLAKPFRATELYLMLPEYCKTFDSL